MAILRLPEPQQIAPGGSGVAVAALLVALLLAAGPSAGAAHAQSPVTNQSLRDTTAFIPEHGERRRAQFASEPVVTGRVMFLGDSITEGGDWQALLGDTTVVNRGISGDVTFGILSRLDDVIRRRPSKVFLLIGINDIGKDIPDAVIVDNIRKIVAAIHEGSPGTEIFVQSLLPVNSTVDRFPQHYDKLQHVLNTNRLLRIMTAASGATFVDLFPDFVDRHYRLDPRLTNDGLHLNREGYETWVRHLRENGAVD